MFLIFPFCVNVYICVCVCLMHVLRGVLWGRCSVRKADSATHVLCRQPRSLGLQESILSFPAKIQILQIKHAQCVDVSVCIVTRKCKEVGQWSIKLSGGTLVYNQTISEGTFWDTDASPRYYLRGCASCTHVILQIPIWIEKSIR